MSLRKVKEKNTNNVYLKEEKDIDYKKEKVLMRL